MYAKIIHIQFKSHRGAPKYEDGISFISYFYFDRDWRVFSFYFFPFSILGMNIIEEKSEHSRVTGRARQS